LSASCTNINGPIILNWTDTNSSESNYQIARRVNNGDWNRNYFKTGPNVTSYQDNDTGYNKYNNTYSYNVRACYNDCNIIGPYARQVDIRCPTPTATPTPTPYCQINNFNLEYKAYNGGPACYLSQMTYTNTGWGEGWSVVKNYGIHRYFQNLPFSTTSYYDTNVNINTSYNYNAVCYRSVDSSTTAYYGFDTEKTCRVPICDPLWSCSVDSHCGGDPNGYCGSTTFKCVCSSRPTETPTPTPANISTPTPTRIPTPPTPTNTPTPNQTPTPTPLACLVCNTLCSTNNQCCTGYCYGLSNSCRNSDCLLQTNCVCSPTPTTINTPTPTLTRTPTSTPTRTPTPTKTPTPTLYPTVVISGTLKKYSDNACSSSISTSNISININPQFPSGVTSSCGVTPAAGEIKSSYRCTVVFDNQNARPTPAQNLYLSASAVGYSSGYWSNPNNTCTSAANNTLFVNVSSGNSTVYNKDIFFRTNPWIKLKNSSFSGLRSLTNPIPQTITPYDSDDNGQRYFIINSGGSDPGLVSAPSINTGDASVSVRQWQVSDYALVNILTPAKFLSYTQTRKEYKVINNLENLTQDEVNLWQGDLTINDTNSDYFKNKKIVLIVNGTVTLNVSNFDLNGGALAIVAQTINFDSSVAYAEGIFVAQNVDTGSTTNQGLKIKGNLVALANFNNNRYWLDNSKPSLFIVFSPKMYLDLLPYLSIAKYNWQQLQ
jgi:hypothetical protein